MSERRQGFTGQATNSQSHFHVESEGRSVIGIHLIESNLSLTDSTAPGTLENLRNKKAPTSLLKLGL
jgi:hypothetical protein